VDTAGAALLRLAFLFEHPAQLLTGCFLDDGRNLFGLLDGLSFLARATEPLINPPAHVLDQVGQPLHWRQARCPHMAELAVLTDEPRIFLGLSVSVSVRSERRPENKRRTGAKGENGGDQRPTGSLVSLGGILVCGKGARYC